MQEILKPNQINEASVLVAIENFVLSSLDAPRQPRSFYEKFTDLLFDFDQIYKEVLK